MATLKQYLSGALVALLPAASLYAADKSRGLWACKTERGRDIMVSWRMRATDAPKSTTYTLFADGKEVFSSTSQTNVILPTSYENATFSLEVKDAAGTLIGSQAGTKVDPSFVRTIKLNHPADYRMADGFVAVYSPNDASAYDMDGDGEQEIILSWEGNNIGAKCTATAPPILDCYKLDGTLMWRINYGPNVLGGCRFTFLCYDFDGDGYGEVIGKTAQGTRDATGNFLSKGAAAGANHYASSVNGAGVITDGGKEWITCFDGRTGKELATIDYWPYFNIQKNWNPSGTKDDNTYGHRGNWFKGTVAALPVNGVKKNCFVTVRGIYTFSYAAAYSWDGKNLSNVWRHTSDKPGQGIYGEGAHSVSCADLDGDGYDEVLVGAAALDHDGKLLWRTGLGHGDATHIGDFDVNNPGLEVFIVQEESTAPSDCALIDGRTGKILMSKKQSGGDTGRGLAMDLDPNTPGHEFFEISYENIFDSKGKDIAPWHTGTTSSSSINYRIYWDGDLQDEYHDRSHVDHWNPTTKLWDRTCTLYSFGYANVNNGSKNNPCLQADLYGDWREEAVYWGSDDAGNYFMTIFTTPLPSEYKLPWLRDDHQYDVAVAWQNCGYNQPPHLSYSPVEYYKKLDNAGPATIGRWGSGGARNQTVAVGSPMVETVFNFTNCTSVKVVGILPPGVTATVVNGQLKIGGTPTRPGVYQYSLQSVGAYDGNDITAPGGEITVPFAGAATLTKHGAGSSSQAVEPGAAIVDFSFSWTDATTVEVTGLPEGLKVTIDNVTGNVYISGTVTAKPGKYEYTVATVGNPEGAVKKGTISVLHPADAELSRIVGAESIEMYQGDSVPEIVFLWANADSAKVEGLPEGISYGLFFQNNAVKLQGVATAEPGVYDYKVVTIGGNAEVELAGTITVLKKASTGVEATTSAAAVSVTPNPMEHAAVVTVAAPACNWSLYTADGHLCRTGLEESEADTCRFTLHRESLSSGTYILRIEAAQAATNVKVIVK